MNLVGIYKLFYALRNLDVHNNDISGESYKIKYIQVAPNSTHQRQSTLIMYATDKIDTNKKVRQPRNKH